MTETVWINLDTGRVVEPPEGTRIPVPRWVSDEVLRVPKGHFVGGVEGVVEVRAEQAQCVRGHASCGGRAPFRLGLG